MVVSIVLSLSYCALDIFATGKYINHRDEYGLEIPTNLQSLHFHGPEKTIKLPKTWNNKDRSELKQNCKTLSKVKCMQIFCMKCIILDVSPIKRSVLGDNVSWNLKIMPTIGQLQNSGAKYVSNKMLRQIQNFSVCLSNASAKKTAKDLAETFAYNVGNGFSIPQHFA